MPTRATTLFLALGLAAALAAGCGGSNAPPTLPESSSFAHHKRAHHGSGSSPITHIVLMIQENRTFNNFFATFPGAVGSTTGEELVENKTGTGYVEQTIPLHEALLTKNEDVVHRYAAFLTAWNNGAMDGFNLIPQRYVPVPVGKAPYQYVNPSSIAPYWTIASQWGLADEMFQTQGSDSFTAHQDLIRGGTCITVACNETSYGTESIVDAPDTGNAWGCDSSAGATTHLITGALLVLATPGPFPCSNQFPDYASGGYETLRDLLDAKSISWKYYTPIWKENTSSALWNAFDVIAPVRYGSEWTTNVISPETTIFTDIQNGALPSMAWVIPKAQNSDHPGRREDYGPSWVASVVNAIGNSQYWDSTAVIVVWDDWGGFYDPVAPPTPRDNQGGPGLRVPMLVISPYVQTGTGSQGGYISNTAYSFGSILRFIEDTFDLGRLGTSDTTWPSIADMFDYSQTPRAFVTIPSTYKRAFFMHQKPSNVPVDDE
jgi:phospholipase C